MSVVLRDDLEVPGRTDGMVIEISSSLSHDERKVVLLHELGHILLGHVPKSKYRNYDPRISNLAGDAEIAITMYGDDEEEVMGRPRSQLDGGITRQWVKENAPGCRTFSELYEHLKKNGKTEDDGNVWPMPVNTPGDGESDDGKDLPPSVIEALKEACKEAITKKVNGLSAVSKIEKMSAIKPKPRRKGVSDYVAEVADEALARRRSWRRMSRRPNDPFLKKGVVSERTRPKVSVYVDRSGSFNQDKTMEAEKELEILSRRYGYIVDFDSFFFGGTLSAKDDIRNMSTNYAAVADHIISTRPRLAVVITDDDPCDNLPARPKETRVVVKTIGCTSSNFASHFDAILC